MLNIVLFGPPGAGKGTQSEKLIEKYQLTHISTGDIFRFHLKEESELGLLAKGYMSKGALVPDEVTIKMLATELDKTANSKGFIFDGFPRTTSQAAALEDLLQNRSCTINMMLALDVPEEELKNRLLERAKTSGRTDDADLEVIQQRLEVYRDKTLPVKEFYQQQDKYTAVQGLGSIDEIFDRLCKVLDTYQDTRVAAQQ